jgi:hypothetical protein
MFIRTLQSNLVLSSRIKCKGKYYIPLRSVLYRALLSPDKYLLSLPTRYSAVRVGGRRSVLYQYVKPTDRKYQTIFVRRIKELVLSAHLRLDLPNDIVPSVSPTNILHLFVSSPSHLYIHNVSDAAQLN